MLPLNTQNYRRILVLTGAGVSQASGIPTFRGPSGQVSAEYYRLSDARNLPELLPEMWAANGNARKRLKEIEPNEAHLALARWQNKWRGPEREITIVTQNVDGLHQRAGASDVIEIHGSLMRSRCTNPDCSSKPSYDNFVPVPDKLQVPKCPVCGFDLRPDLTLFNEPLPTDSLARVKQILRDCDLFLAVGTSGVVSPASDFVRGAAYAKARTILVNLTPMEPKNHYFEEEYLGKAEEILLELLD
jgi:NAD-dependent deacetylase